MPSQQARVRAYHERSKHQLQRYAAGPETLDWDAQPAPFRHWAGAQLTPLPLVADGLVASWAAVHGGAAQAVQPMGLAGIGGLFELSLAITAWKQQGPDRWAVRANPSSGNLHPTEAYLLAQGVPGLADGLYHYAADVHALALRHEGALLDAGCGLWLGLSSVYWREAWKYGERAFRYCQLDAGHALGAVRYAAAVLGWQAVAVDGLGHEALAALMGLDRDADFGKAEREEPEMLIRIGLPAWPLGVAPSGPKARAGAWLGQANVLDPHPMYRWPVIDEVARATRESAAGDRAELDVGMGQTVRTAEGTGRCAAVRADLPASTLIRERRSAQHFDKRVHMPVGAFFRVLDALLPGVGLPFDAWPHAPRVHAVLFVHRVDGLAPGAYVLPRSAEGEGLLRALLQTGLAWQAVDEAPTGLPLYRLMANPALSGTLRTLSCHQAIASDACFALSLLADFDAALVQAPSQYRALFHEAGLMGQVLYLQAEAEGLRGTGIGCYFDDAVHELLGVQGQSLQVLYHFTVGMPITDPRIASEPPYAGRPVVPVPEI